MIATIIILAVAFTWLGFETQWLSIRLPVGKQPVNKTLLLSQGEVKPQPLLLDTFHTKSSEFIPLDMPDFTGNINIVCKRC